MQAESHPQNLIHAFKAAAEEAFLFLSSFLSIPLTSFSPKPTCWVRESEVVREDFPYSE